MSTFNTRTEFTSLTDLVIKYTIFKIVVLVTIIVTLYNAIRSDGYQTIIRNYQEVNRIADTSWGVPYTNDWFIDHMFLSHGIYAPDSLDALREVVKREDDSPLFSKASKLIYDDADTGKAYHNGPPERGAKLQGIKKQLESLLHKKGLAKPQLAEQLLAAYIEDEHRSYRNDSNAFERTKYHVDSLSKANKKLAAAQLNAEGDKFLDNIRFQTITPAPLPPGIGDRLPHIVFLEILRLPDTVKIGQARLHQVKLLNTIKKQVAAVFLLKLSFLTDVSLNIQYWIFILPFLLILSFLYLYILRQKMIVVRHYAEGELSREDANGNYPKGLTSFDDHPYRFLVTIFVAAIAILMVLFFYTFSVILINIPGFKNDIIIGTLTTAYFAIAYGAVYRQRLLREHIGQHLSAKLIDWWNGAVKWLGKRYLKPRRSRPLRGSIILLMTLILAVCSRGCQRMSPMEGEHYYIFYQNKWKTTDKVNFGSESFLYTGLELIFKFKKDIWDWGSGGVWPNRVYQSGYILVMTMVLCYFLNWLARRSVKLRNASFNVDYSMALFTGLLILLFSIYYSVHFSYLSFSLFLTGALAVIWIYDRGKEIYRPSPWTFLDNTKKVLFYSLPYVLASLTMMAFTTGEMILGFSKGIEKEGLKSIWVSFVLLMFLNGKVFLYVGMLYFYIDLIREQYAYFNPQQSAPRLRRFLGVFPRRSGQEQVTQDPP